MSKMLAPLTIELSSKPHPDETQFLRLTRDGVLLASISLGAGDTVVGLGSARLVTAGTALNQADVLLTGNWGSSPTITFDPGSTDSRGMLRIVHGVGGGSGARTWVLTFKDGAYAVTPYAIVLRINSGAVTDLATTPTTLTTTVSGIANEGTEFAFAYHVIG